MEIEVVHERRIERPVAAVFADLEALGTEADRIWPTRRPPFVRTAGPMVVGVTREQHGPIHAVLSGYEPDRSIVWRAEVPFLEGQHGFRVTPDGDGAAVVAHELAVRTRWWFTPVWRLWMADAHDRIVLAMLRRLASPAS